MSDPEFCRNILSNQRFLTSILVLTPKRCFNRQHFFTVWGDVVHDEPELLGTVWLEGEAPAPIGVRRSRLMANDGCWLACLNRACAVHHQVLHVP